MSLYSKEATSSAARILEPIFFKKMTGYDVGDKYDLPRIKANKTINTVIFPFIVFDEKEAKDRFGEDQYFKIKTKIPGSENPDWFEFFYHKVFISKLDFNFIEKIFIEICKLKKWQFESVDATLKRFSYYYFSKYKTDHKKIREKFWLKDHWKIVLKYRKLVPRDIDKVLHCCKCEPKFFNIARGMLFYRIFRDMDDISGD